MKVERHKTVRRDVQQKIQEALASKPTNAYLQSRGLTPEQVHQMYGGKVAPKNVRRSKNSRRSKGPNQQPRPLYAPGSFERPNYKEFTAPAWFKSTENVDVSIIVPMFNSRKQIQEQIASWDFTDDGLTKEIIYVDDCCPQHSYEEVISSWNERKNQWDAPIGRIIINDKNGGFAFACNTGAKFASGKYLIFLNADCVVTPNWIKPMVSLMQANPEIGIVGNLQLRKNSKIVESAGSEWDGKLFEHIGKGIFNGQRLPTAYTLDNLPQELKEPGERQMVTASCMLISRKLFNQVGGFDTEYRIGYWEDSDLNMKVRSLNYKIFYEPKSLIYHTPGHAQSGHNKYVNHNKQRFFSTWVESGILGKFNKPRRSIDIKNSVVYTAITSGYDSLMDSQHVANSKFVAFLEDPSVQSKTWEIKKLERQSPDDNRCAKIYKALPHLYFPDYEYSLWIDGNCQLLQPVQRLIQTFLQDADMALFKHPERNCLYVEAITCSERNLDNPAVIAKQISQYRQEKFPENAGLSECTIMLRRHSPLMEKFNQAWWEEICKGSKRDQISFPYIAKKVGIKYNYFPGSLRISNYIFHKTTSHRRR